MIEENGKAIMLTERTRGIIYCNLVFISCILICVVISNLNQSLMNIECCPRTHAVVFESTHISVSFALQYLLKHLYVLKGLGNF